MGIKGLAKLLSDEAPDVSSLNSKKGLIAYLLISLFVLQIESIDLNQ